MSSAFFRTETHLVDSSHIRQYPHALIDEQEDVLQLAVKQYTPLNNLSPHPGDVTIIAAHANGVGKELYEPLWDELLNLSVRSNAFRIRNIWMADVAWQGESGVLNEHKLGNDPSWYDHPRDLMHFVNTFRKHLPLPIVGVGHSMGGNHIVNLSLMHPRLLAGVVLIDPVIHKAPDRTANLMPAILSTSRRDRWPSRQAAEAAMRRNKFYQTWDPRCFNLWIKHGLRDLPTAVYPASEITSKGSVPKEPLSNTPDTPSVNKAKPVTLTTTKYQEVFTFLRSNYPAAESSLESYQPDRRTHPDLPGTALEKPFYRPEPHITFGMFPHLRPPCFFVFAKDHSVLSSQSMIKERLQAIGRGVGGNGGPANGTVTMVDIKGAGHFVPFEKPKEVAENMGRWLGATVQEWRKNVELERRGWVDLDPQQKRTFDKDWLYWTSWSKREAQRDEQEDKDHSSKL